MSAVTHFSAASSPEPGLAPYRAISRAAVIATVMSAFSFPLVILAGVSTTYDVGDAVPLGGWGAALAIVAFVFGLVATRTIRRFPTEYTGRRLAAIGVFGGPLLAITGIVLATYTHVTELPPGCERVGFSELQPDPEQPELPISPKAIELHAKQIFIKGYMHPGVASSGKVNHFILVPDMGTCCFGGQPKMTDMIEVVAADSENVAYSTRRIKLAGTFQLYMQPTQSLGLSGVVFHLEAARVY